MLSRQNYWDETLKKSWQHILGNELFDPAARQRFKMPQVSEIADFGLNLLPESTNSAAGIALESGKNFSVGLVLVAINPH